MYGQILNQNELDMLLNFLVGHILFKNLNGMAHI